MTPIGTPKYVREGRIRRINPEYVALWESYLDEGLSAQHVAEIFGVATTSVLMYYPGRGWTREEARAHGTFMKHHNAKMRKILPSYA